MNKKGTQKFIITGNEINRADLVSVEKFQITRNQAQNYLKSGQILVNNKTVLPKQLLQKGDVLTFIELIREGVNIHVPIIYEDRSILVIDKPSGISTHPAPGEKEITISEIFQDRLDFPSSINNPGIIHRLDKGTSGVMVLAKNKEIQVLMQQLFKLRKVKKTYLALVDGVFMPKEGIIDLPLKRDLLRRGRIGISKSGKKAKTKYRVLKHFNRFSYLEVMPETGRTHQIRVHLSSLGYPVVQDRRYGRKTFGSDRMFLHAHKIEFIHPKTKKRVIYTSKLPKDLADKLANLT